MAKFYSNPQFVLSAKPSVNPPEGFVEVFVDIENNGCLTYLFPNGDTMPITGALTMTGGGAGLFPMASGGNAFVEEFDETINGGGAIHVL